MATLCLREMGKFLWKGWEKALPCWLSQFSKTKLQYLKNEVIQKKVCEMQLNSKKEKKKRMSLCS